jgi:TonB family protein
MGLFFIYSLKVAFCLIAFYLVFKLLLSKETFHTFNRWVLLLVMVVSILLPWLKVTTAEPTAIAEGMISLESIIASAEVVNDDTQEGLSAIQLLFIIYIIGIAVFFLREVVSIVRLYRLIRRGTPLTAEQAGVSQHGVRVVVMKNEIAPFSWFRHVVLSEKDFRENPREILTHELAHIRLGHSWDVAVCNLLIIFQWWNPAAWLLKRELQNVHEFEADEAVINRGVDAKQYQLLLIRKSVGERLFSMANNLNHQSLKKRITMMTTKKSSPWQKAKVLVALPMAALAVVAFANPDVERVAEQVETESQAVVEKAKADVAGIETAAEQQSAEKQEVADEQGKNVSVKGVVVQKEDGNPIVGVAVTVRGTKIGAVTDVDGKFHIDNVPVGSWIDVFMIDCEIGSLQVTEQNASNLHFVIAYDGPSSSKSPGSDAFDMVEEMPVYPGGMPAMMDFFYKNMKYPKEAFDAKQEGRVIAQFVVEKDGSITDAHIVKSVSPALDAEALRIVNAMPNWTPGRQNGKPVRVKYTVPISFKLTGGETNKAKDDNVNTDNTVNNKAVKETIEKDLALKVKNLLLVVDGKEVPESEIDKYLSPEKIQSITVIKDKAKVKAIYGNAANGKQGAIEITMKK